MTYRRVAVRSAQALVALAVLGMVAGSALGQPLVLSYVETDSMSPTLDAGDGFVAVPPALAGEVERGDVVVYEAKQLHGGGLTTHRVVGETANGYVTRGDANPFTDQGAGEPPVTEGQIRAVALQVGGSVVVVPELGTAAMALERGIGAVQGGLARAAGRGVPLYAVGLLLLGAGGMLYGLNAGGSQRSRPDRRRGRGTVDGRLVLLALALVVVVPLTTAMVVPGGAQDIGIVSAQSESPADHVVEQGETERRTYPVHNGGVLPVVVYLEPASEGVAVAPSRTTVAGGETRNATLALSAPPETGYYVRSLVERRYVAVLPVSLIDALYRVHPWAPIVAIDAIFGGGFYLLGWALLGSGRVRVDRRSSAGKRSPARRLLRRLG